MITTVTPNPARDVTYRVPQVRIGQSHRVEVLGTRAGGKGMNCAGVLSCMETPHRALAIVGEADREWWERDAAHRGICSEALVVAEPHRVRLSTALVHEDHEVTVLNEPGLGPPPAAWRGLVDASVATAEALDVIAWCGSVPAQAPEAMLADAVHRGVVSGAHVVIDGSGTWLLAAVAAGPAIVTVNRQEAVGATGVKQPAAAARRLCALGATASFVSDGPRGVVLAVGDDGPVLRASLPTPLRGNPTGAGDAMTAALCAELDGRSLPRTVQSWASLAQKAVAWAGAAVSAPLAGVVDPQDVARLLLAVEVEELDG